MFFSASREWEEFFLHLTLSGKNKIYASPERKNDKLFHEKNITEGKLLFGTREGVSTSAFKQAYLQKQTSDGRAIPSITKISMSLHHNQNSRQPILYNLGYL